MFKRTHTGITYRGPEVDQRGILLWVINCYGFLIRHGQELTGQQFGAKIRQHYNCTTGEAGAVNAAAAGFVEGLEQRRPVVEEAPCPVCKGLHEVCAYCHSERVQCGGEKDPEPFSWCESCERSGIFQ